MKKQPDTNDSVRSKAVAQRAQLEARIEELKTELGKHEFALRQIDQLIGPTGSPQSPLTQSALSPGKSLQESKRMPGRPPVRPPVGASLQLAKKPVKRRNAAKKRAKSDE